MRAVASIAWLWLTSGALASSAAAQIDAAVGNEHRCELAGGRVRCIGWERREHCDPHRSWFDVAVPDPVIAIDAGTSLACAVTESRSLWCWGWDDTSVCCPETSCPATQLLPREIAGVAGHAIDVTIADSVVCARLDDGTAACWGRGDGALGWALRDHPVSSAGRDDRAPPARPGDVARVTDERGTPIARVAEVALAGSRAACVRDDAGSVWCWGSGEHQVVPGCGEHEQCGARRAAVPFAVAWLQCGHGGCCAVSRESGATPEDRRIECWGTSAPYVRELIEDVPDWIDLALEYHGACVITATRVECAGEMRPGDERGPRWDGFTVRGRRLRRIDTHLSSSCVETSGAPVCWGGESMPPFPERALVVPVVARAHWRRRPRERVLRTRVTPVACGEDAPYDHEPPPRLVASARRRTIRVAVHALVYNCAHPPPIEARRLSDGTIELGIGNPPEGAALARCECLHDLVVRVDGVDPGAHDVVFEGHPDARVRVDVP